MRAVLDACVLYPSLVRGLLLDAAAAGVFAPLWSARIVAEWTHAAARETPEALLALEAAALARDWPGAEVAVDPGTEAALSLPDPDDTHVLAAAIDGRADALVTFNLKDFPGRTLGRHGLTLWHPDPFLLEALRVAEAPIRTAVSARLADLDMTPRAALKRARLPRFAKAMDA